MRSCAETLIAGLPRLPLRIAGVVRHIKAQQPLQARQIE